MSKFPSIQSVLHATQKSIQRFPLETIAALNGTICAILLLDKEGNGHGEFLIKTIMSCSLCLVLFLSISLFFEASNKNKLLGFLSSLFLGGITVAFVFSFQKEITNVEIQHYFVLNIAFHLLVSFAGFLPKAYYQEEFWEFNKRLLFRFSTALNYSVVLFSGLALAILSVQELFKVEFDKKIYGYLLCLIAGIFNTLFFLNGVPETNNAKNPLILNYPNWLKKYTQYVLIPLISLYLVILICYEAKILVTLSLPVGWVSYLVLVFAIFGILSFLLVHPIANISGNLWMQTFNKWFYYLLIPLLGLLYWAILYRINLYGFTHERYYVLLLAIWLTVVVAYFLIQKQPEIKFIPISMCIAGLLSIAGPQSADSVSKNSQLNRFEKYMQNTEKSKLNFKQEQDLSSIVDFLEKNYGAKILLSYTNDKLNALLKKVKNPNSYEIMKALGYEYRSPYDKRDSENTEFYYNYYPNNENVIENIHGYDLFFILSKNTNLTNKESVKINTKTYIVTSLDKDYGVELQINKEVIPLRIFDFIYTNTAFNKNNFNQKISQKIETKNYSILINYQSVNGKMGNNKKTIEHFNIAVLVAIKNANPTK